MKSRNHIVGVFLFALLFSAAMPAAAKKLPRSDVRIGILAGVKSFNVSSEGGYSILEIANGRSTEGKPLSDFPARAEGDRLTIDGESYLSPLRIIPREAAHPVRIDGRRYRGTLTVRASGGKLTVVNELSLEEYIYGILPREVNPSWPAESLKAQAVVSRTYTLRNLRRHGQGEFDLCDETHCQVYGGMESEDPRSNAAVDATKDEVLVYDGELAQTLFHASCAGHTVNPNNVWSWDRPAPPYLKGQVDRYCKNSPHNAWKNSITAQYLETRLAKSGYEARGITRISLAGRDGSGRAKAVKVSSRKGTITIPASKFRMAIDPWLIKSTFLTRIAKDGASFVFQGKGWGHGVGMCQWGAKEMAGQGREYRKILTYFYPGTVVETWEE